MAEVLATEGPSGRALALPGAAARVSSSAMLGRLRDLAAQPAVARSMPLIALAGMLGLAALIWMAFAQAPQRDLFRGLADGDKAAVADALKTAGIPYRIDRDTGALTVPDGDFYRAKMLLAQQGLPKSAPDGDALIASLPMGASRAVEGERLRGARELDLARTIEAIDAVQRARVHVAVDQPSAFLRDTDRPAASVMLTLHSGRTLSETQVAAIAHLVASSVPGLTPESVSIVDQSGRLLSRTGDGATGASDRQLDIQRKVEARYAEALDTLLIPLVGPGNYTAEVHADLDFAEVQATRETYPKDAAVVRQEEGGWTKDGGPDGPAVGIPGALSNMAPPAAQVAAAPGGTIAAPKPGQPDPAAEPGTTVAQTAGRTTENYNRTFQIGREVSVTKQPVGTVRRLSIAVALKQGKGKEQLNPAAIAQIEALVKGAVGFDAERGDMLAINARDFAPVADTPATPLYEKPWVPLLARNLSALLIAALLIFGLARPFLKRRGATLAAPSLARAERSAVGHQIAAALADEARRDPGHTVTLDMIEAAPGYTARAELIRNFVRQNPSRAALVVRDLIRADGTGGA
ncbi:MAG TPA: flagellar basal-body MS-ring/collar protein FliF [Sphingomonadaceae bacterium]|nr:flagellar basal-body MS-ring/collar protein FliF [Sphingomonadaceae bacterium]